MTSNTPLVRLQRLSATSTEQQINREINDLKQQIKGKDTIIKAKEEIIKGKDMVISGLEAERDGLISKVEKLNECLKNTGESISAKSCEHLPPPTHQLILCDKCYESIPKNQA